ncbi:MAG: hypothetical protein ACLTYN_03720 [Dysosmobacter welbionis]
MGLLSKQGGEVRFDGVEISALSARRSQKGGLLSRSDIPAILRGGWCSVGGSHTSLSPPVPVGLRHRPGAGAGGRGGPGGATCRRAGRRSAPEGICGAGAGTDTVLMDEPTTYMDAPSAGSNGYGPKAGWTGRAVVLVSMICPWPADGG